MDYHHYLFATATAHPCHLLHLLSPPYLPKLPFKSSQHRLQQYLGLRRFYLAILHCAYNQVWQGRDKISLGIKVSTITLTLINSIKYKERAAYFILVPHLQRRLGLETQLACIHIRPDIIFNIPQEPYFEVQLENAFQILIQFVTQVVHKK